jgi:hypothetical protein
MRALLVLFVIAIVPGFAWAADDELDKAQEAYRAAMEKAEQTLLSAFDKNADLIRQSSKKAEEKQRLIEQLKAEKTAFEQHGWYPWSATSRPALVEFIRTRLTAEKAFATAFDKVIDAHLKAKEDTQAAAITKLKKDALAPKLIARWEITGVTWNGKWVGMLYSNGHYSDANGKAVWSYDRGVILLSQPEQGLPNNTKVLKWTLKDNGIELDEVGNNGGKSTGKLVNLIEKK